MPKLEFIAKNGISAVFFFSTTLIWYTKYQQGEKCPGPGIKLGALP